MAKEVELSLEQAIEFLLSPLSINNSDPHAKGGFYGFQNTSKPVRNTDKPFIFYEITGYGIDLLLKLYRWFGDRKFLELAKNSGESLLKAQLFDSDKMISGAFYDRYYHETNSFFETFHSYPNAVCIGALCELHSQTGDERFRKAARGATNWLFQMLCKENNKCIGFAEFYSEKQAWTRIYPYESICIPFILLKFQKDLTLSEEQKSALEQVILWGRSSQQGDGFFPFFYLPRYKQFNNTAYSHFTIYPLYNLMGYPLSELEDLGYNGSFDSYIKCGNWLVKVQADDGGFYTYYHQSHHAWHQQSPAVGQALCSFIHLYQKTKDKRFLESAKKCANWLMKNQLKDDKYKGSFYWVYPNKSLTSFQKKIQYAKERLSSKLSQPDFTSDVTVLLDKLPIWSVQFTVEGLHMFGKLEGSF